MAYTPTIWKDGQAPALNAENLNKMEHGIVNANTVANQALEAAQTAGIKVTSLWVNPNENGYFTQNGVVQLENVPRDAKFIGFECSGTGAGVPYRCSVIVPFDFVMWIYSPVLFVANPIIPAAGGSQLAVLIAKINISNISYTGTAELSGYFSSEGGNFVSHPNAIYKIFTIS